MRTGVMQQDDEVFSTEDHEEAEQTDSEDEAHDISFPNKLSFEFEILIGLSS